jgi:hypothetical protein
MGRATHLDLWDQNLAATTMMLRNKGMLLDRTDDMSASYIGSRKGALMWHWLKNLLGQRVCECISHSRLVRHACLTQSDDLTRYGIMVLHIETVIRSEILQYSHRSVEWSIWRGLGD